MTVSTLEDSLPPVGEDLHAATTADTVKPQDVSYNGSDKKILLLRRSIHETSFHGMYELPGGKLEEGRLRKAALIETKEEADDVRIYRLSNHIDHDMKSVPRL